MFLEHISRVARQTGAVDHNRGFGPEYRLDARMSRGVQPPHGRHCICHLCAARPDGR
jgi:hypothetical protein